eukprot:Awhi_evm1s14984
MNVPDQTNFFTFYLGYGAPPQGYGAPPQGYASAPPQQGAYGAPHQGAYGAPQQGAYGAPPQGAAPAGYPGQVPGSKVAGYASAPPGAYGAPTGSPAGYPGAAGATGVVAGAGAVGIAGMSQNSTGAKPPKGKPTVKPVSPFKPDQDAQILRKAMKGLGTDEKSIINVVCNRTLEQRLEIGRRFKAIFGRDLVKDLKSETSGCFKDILNYMHMPAAEYDATTIYKAIDGIGTNEAHIIEILASRTNKEIHAITKEYTRKYGRGMEKDIKGDTSGHFEKLLIALCKGQRDESFNVVKSAVEQDARALYQAGEGRWGTDEHTFNRILISKSIYHLRAVFDEYKKLSKRTISEAIDS